MPLFGSVMNALARDMLTPEEYAAWRERQRRRESLALWLAALAFALVFGLLAARDAAAHEGGRHCHADKCHGGKR